MTTTATPSKAQIKRDEIANAKKQLIENYQLIDGARVYVSIASVSSSGMSRTMRVFVVNNNELYNVTYYVGQVLGWTVKDNKYGQRVIKVDGAGMDMAFHLVNCLSYALHADGYALKHETI
jgi:hypothetical protein